MTRHAIVGRFGPLDQSQVATDEDEVVTQLDFLTGQRRLGYGVGQALEDLVTMGVFPTEIGLDAALLATLVHAADTRISRATESQDSWTREVHLAVPVSAPEAWTGVAPLLTRMLNFLTGDRWTLSFRARPAGYARLIAPKY